MSASIEFADFIQSCGGILKGVPVMDGQSHRIASVSDEKGKRSMLYRGYLDGVPNGWVHDFKSGEKHSWKASDSTTGLTPEELIKLNEEIAENARRRAVADAERFEKTTNVSRAVVKSCITAGSHPYLYHKHIKGFGILQATRESAILYNKIESGDLILPLYNPVGGREVVSFQAIKPNGDKSFLQDSVIKGSYGLIGKPEKFTPSILCEGFATGATLHLLTGRPVIIALNASNLPSVAANFKGYDIIVAADNDRHLPLKVNPNTGKPLDNVGVKYAEMTGFPVINPSDEETGSLDWNDYFTKYGREKTLAHIKEQNNDVVPSKENTEIILKGGEDSEIAEKIETILKDRHSRLYYNATGIVMPALLVQKGHSSGVSQIINTNEYGIIAEASKFITFKKYNAVGKLVPCSLSTGFAKILMARAHSGETKLPKLEGVITSPTLRPDFTVLHRDGYDETTGFYHFKDATLNLQSMPKTKEQARKSMALLKNIFVESPFVTDAARSVALAGVMTLTLRAAIKFAPLFAVVASTAGSGKSFIVDVASLVALGITAPVTNNKSDEDEMNKVLGGLLLQGERIISIDNCNGELGGDLLCQAVTQENLKVRKLGASDVLMIRNGSTFFATGNGLRPVGDLTRRTLLCGLDANMERPESREFKHYPLRDIARDRGKYISAVLNVVLSFLAADDKPNIPDNRAFEDWNYLIRGSLLWLGEADPCDTVEDVKSSDPEIEDLTQVISAIKLMRDLNVGSSITITDGISLLTSTANSLDYNTRDEDKVDSQSSLNILTEIAGSRGVINSRRLGKYLSKNEGRIIGGQKIVSKGKDRNGVKLWTVEEVK